MFTHVTSPFRIKMLGFSRNSVISKPMTSNLISSIMSSILKAVTLGNILNYNETNLIDDPGRKGWLYTEE